MRVRSVSCLAVERLQALPYGCRKPTAPVACVKHAEVQIPPQLGKQEIKREGGSLAQQCLEFVWRRETRQRQDIPIPE
jgi:hypothetical protein